MTESSESATRTTAATVYPPHQGFMWPHSSLGSFTCQTCARRCIADGRAAIELGRDYIREHAEEWVRLDGTT